MKEIVCRFLHFPWHWYSIGSINKPKIKWSTRHCIKCGICVRTEYFKGEI